ncbi:MAG: CobQ/CobB/MinD/ParA nucleotide binding domain protein [Planctomycetota bacterium]|nr:CobQ/CobB/MinD/ParA nucleotide binding domain protein [Planctomycetota bacterium]
MPAFIVSDHESTAARIRDILTFSGQECPSSHILPNDEAAYRLGRETKVDLVVVALPHDREHGIVLLSNLGRVAPGRILAVGPTNDAKFVLQALRAGAFDYVDVADLEAELDAAIHRRAEDVAGPPEPGRLIAVLGPNGGSGSSTLAVNIAASLAKEHKRVGLLDLKLESGDLAALLDVRPTFTLADICQNAARLDRVMFEKSLIKHESGVNLLAAPQNLVEVAHIRPEGVGLAVTLSRIGFPVVVVDLDHSFREEQLLVLRQADVVLLVFRLDFTSLRNVRRTLEHLETLGVPREKVRLVVNRHGQYQEVPRAKAEEALGMKIGHFVPEDAKTVNRANNQGVPVVLASPSAKVSRALAQLAKSVGGDPPNVT